MLNERDKYATGSDIRIRKLTDDPFRHSKALGCPSCFHHDVCGGLSIECNVIDCLDLCCKQPEDCTRCCRNAIGFIGQFREVDGFEFSEIGCKPVRQPIIYDAVVPLIYHGSNRTRDLVASTVSIRLMDIVDFKRQELRYKTRQELCQVFKFPENANIIVSGVDHDSKIERWWELGEKRLKIIGQMRTLNFAAVTVPNFSVTLDRPRTNDLHSIKRIAETYAEFQNEGVPAALHPNGRTIRDFERWSAYIAEHSEIGVISYEFITGPARNDRRSFHIGRLSEIARVTQRPLDIIVRGDPRVVPPLSEYFRRVIYIETTSFLKTVNRQRAVRLSNAELDWIEDPMPKGSCLSGLYCHNFLEQKHLLTQMFAESSNYLRAAA
jgi:Domain of unknown function (DUF4417)